MKAAIATLDAARIFAAARLEAVEQDGSMKALQAEVAHLNTGLEVMNTYMSENDIYKEHLDDKVGGCSICLNEGVENQIQAVERFCGECDTPL